MRFTADYKRVFADESEYGPNWKADGEEWYWACDLETGIVYHVAVKDYSGFQGNRQILDAVKRSLPEEA